MKNYEKYAEEIRNFECQSDFCKSFIKPRILNSSDCNGVECATCYMRQMLWLLEDYEEPETDWSKVEVDTPILVKDYEDAEWDNRRHFAKYENGVVYTWAGGGTSWTSGGHMTSWKYAKLAESEEGGAE